MTESAHETTPDEHGVQDAPSDGAPVDAVQVPGTPATGPGTEPQEPSGAQTQDPA